MLKTSLLFAVSYFLGSIPTGFLVAKSLKNIDLRDFGSGSTGATNVLRNVGKWPALFVFIADVLKGFFAVKIASYYLDNSLIEVLAGLFAISGHIWPVWLRGKGGKAVATGLGMFLALSLKVGFSALGIFLLIISTTKIVSLSSIVAAIFLPFLMYLNMGTFNHPYTVMSALISILVIWKHRSNIERLKKGIEPRINSKD